MRLLRLWLYHKAMLSWFHFTKWHNFRCYLKVTYKLFPAPWAPVFTIVYDRNKKKKHSWSKRWFLLFAPNLHAFQTGWVLLLWNFFARRHWLFQALKATFTHTQYTLFLCVCWQVASSLLGVLWSGLVQQRLQCLLYGARQQFVWTLHVRPWHRRQNLSSWWVGTSLSGER